MDWTKLERDGFKPKASLFDNGFDFSGPEEPYSLWDLAKATCGLVFFLIALGALWWYLV